MLPEAKNYIYIYIYNQYNFLKKKERKKKKTRHNKLKHLLYFAMGPA